MRVAPTEIRASISPDEPDETVPAISHRQFQDYYRERPDAGRPPVSAFESLKKSIVGDEENAIIKSGTLATTRGTGIVVIALIGASVVLDLADFPLWEAIDNGAKISFLIAIGAIWAVLAAADSIARGIATAGQQSRVVPLSSARKAKRLEGADSSGWSVVAVEFGGAADGVANRFLISKGPTTEWVDSEHVSFEE